MTKSESVEKAERERPIYRVLRTVCLTTDRQIYEPGAIVDLSHLPPASRQYFIDNGYFETADGTPANVPAKDPAPCKNC